ncbi:MAG: BadF/BadG/BcrA/BcrD ATPase family protein [Candidatus Acidiferrales bacterium]
MRRNQRTDRGRLKWFLGFDGGGTKTHCVLLDERGRTRAESFAGPSNPRRVPFRLACRELKSAAQECLLSRRISPREITGVCAGIAGAGISAMRFRIAAFLRRLFPAARVDVTTDLAIALDAAFTSGPGIVLVAGTGSAALGRSSRGHEVRAGGKGPRHSDLGSAFDVGRRAIALAHRSPSKKENVSLRRKILKSLRFASWHALDSRVGKNADAVYPKIFPIVAREAMHGNPVARAILSGAAVELAQLVAQVASRLRLRGRGVIVAQAGGMFGRSEFFDAAVRAEILKRLPGAKLRRLRISPAEAAGRRARQDWISRSPLADK